MWTSWTVWMIAAVVLAILEVLAPGFVFLGFAIGAALMGLLMAFSLPILSLSLPTTFLIFAVFSLIAWVLLRQLLGVRSSQVKIIEDDIND